MSKPGIHLDSFTLETEDGDIDAEIRLNYADDGTEMLWHYENGRHVLAHPARRCVACGEIITASHIPGYCLGCNDSLNL